MNKRIALIRKESGLNQQDFADKIGLTKNYVSLMETGARNPSDRTISDICREFNVNPDWLRNGEDPMFMPAPEEDTAYINDLLSELDNPFFEIIRAILKSYSESSPEEKKALDAFARRLPRKTQKKNRD